jgi:hypothetical protein
MMFISDYDVEVTLQFAVRHTARRLRIPDADWKTIHEIREDINEHDPDLARSLSEYIDAYVRWYQWHKAIEHAGKQGVLNADEKRELCELTEARDKTRATIAEKVRSLP